MVLAACAAVVVGVIHFAWYVWAARRLAAVMEECRRRGEPVTAGQLAGDIVGDERNAVPHLLEAGQMARGWSARLPANPEVSSDIYAYPLEQSATASIEGILAANADAMAAFDLAKLLPGVYWRPNADPWLRHVDVRWQARAFQHVSNLLGLEAAHARAVGDDLKAVRRVRDMLWLARVMDGQANWPSHVAALGLEENVIRLLRNFALDLRVSDGAEFRGELRGLIDDLLEEAGRRGRFERAIVGEQVMWAERARAGVTRTRETTKGPPYYEVVRASRAEEWVLAAVRPYVMARSAANMVAAREGREVVGRGWQASWARPRGRGAVAVGGPVRAAVTPPAAWVARLVAAPDYAGEVKRQFQQVAQRRLLATVLAVRLYRVGHGGKWPEKLEELVPDCLTAVPVDPFAADGRGLGYVNGAPGPFVYSVDEDGVDHTATGAAPPVRYRWSDLLVSGADLVAFLTPVSDSPSQAGPHK